MDPFGAAAQKGKKEEEKEEERKKKKEDGQRYPLPLCVMVRGAAAPKGPMTYAQHVLKL